MASTNSPLLQIKSFDGPHRFLSNFSHSKVHYHDFICPTVEHAFQAAKADNFKERFEIVCADTAGQAKRLGRKCSLRNDWEGVKDDIMLSLLRQKFFAIPTLGDMLLETGDAHLYEGNTWGDEYWGVTWHDGQHNGRNQLGKFLMQVRRELVDLIGYGWPVE